MNETHLNRPQKTAVEVHLRYLENSLRQIRHTMRKPEDGILIHYAPVSSETRQRIGSIIEVVLEEIAVVAAEFNLEAEIDYPLNNLYAHVAIASSDIHDLFSKKMTRYGDVDPSLAISLDPHLRSLNILFTEMLRMINQERGRL